MRKISLQNSFPWLLVTAAGGFFGAIVILVGYDYRSETLSRHPEFLVWLSLMIIQTTLIGFFAVPLWLSLKPLKEYWLNHKLDVILSNLVLLVLFIVPNLIIPIFSPDALPSLPNHTLRIVILAAFSFSALIPAWTGILLIRIVAQSGFAELTHVTDESLQINTLKNYLEYRKLLQQYLFLLGILIGLVTLTSGAIRNARIAAGMDQDALPATLVLIYGLYYTVLLVVVYTPTYRAMIDAGTQLSDGLCPLKSPSTMLEDAEKRAKLDEFLKLNVTTEQSLRTGITLLIPLLSSLLSSLLDLKI